jgi:hypothetical protein
MNVDDDLILLALNESVRSDSAAGTIEMTLERVLRQLDASAELMAWETVPLSAFAGCLPDGVLSCWIFAIRAGAATGPERHPNSHQRSFSLVGSGAFELRMGTNWHSHPLTSGEGGRIEHRWVSIPPSTWHRLFVGAEPWGMLSFHTVAPEALIEEKPVDPADLDGDTCRERYTDRR